MSRYSELQQSASPISDITKADYKAFVELQMSCGVNMANISEVSDLTDLSIPKVKAIMKHYSALAKKYD